MSDQSATQQLPHHHLDSDLSHTVHNEASVISTNTNASPSRRSNRQKAKASDNLPATPSASSSSSRPLPTRRSARLSIGAQPETDQPSLRTIGSKRKQRSQPEEKVLTPTAGRVLPAPVSSPSRAPTIQADRKGKQRAPRSPSPETLPPVKRLRPSVVTAGRYSLRRKAGNLPEATPIASNLDPSSKVKGVGKGKKTAAGDMPKKQVPKQKRVGTPAASDRTKKGDNSARSLMDDSMEDDEHDWLDIDTTRNAARSRLHVDEDENMDMSEEDIEEDHSDEEMPPAVAAPGPSGPARDAGGLGGLGSLGGLAGIEEIARRARESGLHLDEATAAALFGGSFRSFGGMMTGMSNRFKRLKTDLRSKSTTTRLAALRECSELLLVSNEDTLGGTFSTNEFAAEFVAILNGKPNIDRQAGPSVSQTHDDELDEDAQLAAALAMSTGGAMPGGFGGDDEQECQLVACRCLAHLLEALPGSGHTLVHLGAVPALCAKLMAIDDIELAEQTLSTMEKISAECPAAIVKAGGLGALLGYLPFFSTNVQRTAVTAAANCCRNISSEYYTQIKDAFPTLRDTLTQADQRLVEQATLAVVRTIEAYRHNASHLEGLLDVPTIVAVNSLLMPSGGSPLVTPNTYTHLLRALTTSARGSAKVAIAFLEAGMTNTIYQILTGVLPSSHDEDEQGAAEGGQGLAGGIADMAVLQNLAHRPKDQVEEALALIVELLPPTPKEGVFDSRGYTEKALGKIKKGRRGDKSAKPTRRSSRVADASATATPGGSAGPATPAENTTPLPTIGTDASIEITSTLRDTVAKAKKDAEIQAEQRIELFKAQPELLGKFVKAIVPVLVDVYAASVTLRVRTKVLMGLVKAIAFAETGHLETTLKAVPMASFLCAIISSKDNAAFVLNALQLVELLATKLPAIYKVSFQREGVVFEVEALAQQELSTVKAAKEAALVKNEPTEAAAPVAGPSTSTITFGSIDPMNPFQEDFKPLMGIPVLSSMLAEVNAAAGPSTTPRKPTTYLDPTDANIIRARVILAKKIFEAEGDEGHLEAGLNLLAITSLVERLRRPEATESEVRDTLRDLTKQFSSPSQSLSSFELLKSGLVDGLLEFVDVEGAVTSVDRRAILYDVFSDGSLANPPALVSLVKRLHESLGRLEDFEVEAAFNGAADARGNTSSLSRTMRVRLQAEEGQDIPRQVSALSITIQAIAPLQALHDYLRPRVADGSMMPMSGLSSMFAAYANAGIPAPRNGEGSAASRIMDAMAAARGQASESSEPANGSNGTRQLPSSALDQAAQTVLGSTAENKSEPTRRRSARLSGAALPNPDEPTTPPPANAHISTSAPEPSVLPQMPMDMDFDDEEYSDEDYDAEVFEDEMEEELGRSADKVVNMSVAPDGSRVEAKTPEGTRIATPNQAAAQQAGMPSGTITPRTGSYAGAVKTAPTDWHLAFTYNGKPISLDETIYGVVHKGQTLGQAPSMAGSYGVPVVFKFRKVNGPAPPKNHALDAPSPASVVSTLPAALDPDTPTSKILRLLRVVHNLAVDNGGQMDENLFVNNKLTAKLTRQLEEIMVIASNCLPEWAVELPKHFSFLFPFETRYSFLQSTSFGYGRLISKFQSTSQSRNGRNRDDISHLARLVRQKVRISRSQLLESCAKVLELYGTSNGTLEVEYFDEIGTGLGPTLEFYSIASQEFARRALNMWRDDDETKEGSYVFHPRGLYPSPARPEEQPASMSGSRLSWFKTLGLFAGRALLDSRIIDVNLNPVFLKLVLGRPVKRTMANLKLVDPALARSLERLQTYLYARKEIEALQLPPGARRNKLITLSVNGAKLPDLSLDFTLPGYNIELKPGGAHIDVDDSNLEEYLDEVLDMTLGSGIMPQVRAFQEGFSMIFPVQDLKIFSPEELGLLLGNADEDWSRETLEHVLKADHGYNLDSRAVQNLIEVMSTYNKDERRQFLQFITGAPKLPIGGFRGLNPPFTVVRKPHEAPFRADDYLPSVMTCAQYLKMPDYSTKEVLASQLERAMLDGGGSFHLS